MVCFERVNNPRDAELNGFGENDTVIRFARQERAGIGDG